MLKVALFGATGGTGKEFVKQSSDYNVEITAFVRNPEKLSAEFPELKTIKCSIDDLEILREKVRDFDVIVSIVGVSGLFQARKPNAIYERTAKNLVKIAEENGISRFITVTSGGIEDAPNEPWFFRYLLKPLFLKNMYEDMKVMEKITKDSNLNYTIVRPPYLTNGKLTKNYQVIKDKWFDDDKDLSRADLAHYLLNCLSDKDIDRRIVGVSY